MSEILTAEIGGVQWWAGTRQYPTVAEAKRAFQELHEHGQRLQGALHVGVYRHGEVGQPNNQITVVGHVHEGVVEALEKLGGQVVELDDKNLTGFVLRRARVVQAMEGAAPGTYRFPHPTGVKINETGEVGER